MVGATLTESALPADAIELPRPRQPVDLPMQPPRLERRHRYLLRVADILALAASAALGAFTLEQLIPLRAGNPTVSQIVVTALAGALALHLHGRRWSPAG